MNYQDFISQTETQYGISLPNLYKRLAADGMLDWGELGSKWYSETFPKLLEHPPLLLVGSEFELPHADELQGINEQLCDDSEWRSLKPEYRGNSSPLPKRATAITTHSTTAKKANHVSHACITTTTSA